MRKGLLLLSTLMMLLVSCRKDMEDISMTGMVSTPTVEIITAGLAGLIVTDNNVPVPNAVVRLGSEVVTSDEDGLFQFPNMEMNARGTYVTVESSGYFHGSKRFYPQGNTRTIIEVELLPLNTVGAIDAAAGGSVSFEDARITLPANGIVDANGTPYNGEVRIAAHWLNPVADNLEDIMPGNLEGIAADGENVAMATFGMLAVELLDAAGNELQVAPEKRAELRFPLPAEISGTAPQEIPLWSFDEAEGLWVEEGSAQLQNGAYVGEVAHFSFWNCDLPITYVFLEGRVVDEAGNPLGGKLVRITDENDGRMGYTTTAEDGTFGGLVPEGQVFTISLVDACGNDANSQMIGPFAEDTDIGDLVFTTPNSFTLSGQAVDCDGEALPDIFVRVNYGESQMLLRTDENGDFSNTFTACLEVSDLTVNAIDPDNRTQSGEQTFAIESTINAGILQVCAEELTAFWESTVNGLNYLELRVGYRENMVILDSLGQDSVLIYTITTLPDTTANVEFFSRLDLTSITPGVLDGEVRNFFYSDFRGPESVSIDCYGGCGDIEVTITRNDGPGGFLQGNYNGILPAAQTGIPIQDASVEGSFSVRIPE